MLGLNVQLVLLSVAVNVSSAELIGSTPFNLRDRHKRPAEDSEMLRDVSTERGTNSVTVFAGFIPNYQLLLCSASSTFLTKERIVTERERN